MKTLGQIVTASAQFLKEKGVSRHRRIADELVALVLGIQRLDLYLQFDRPLEERELACLRPLLKRAASGEPLEYILGEITFYHTQLTLSSAVLIPRPETELLVEKVALWAKGQGHNELELWDLCTGSGCIGIALKKACPWLRVVLVDCSKEALAVAESNAKRNQVELECIEGDVLQGLPERLQGRRADVVVCNPPYVTGREYELLDRSVKEFEPKLALVGGDDGLEYYRQLERWLPIYLTSKAKIFFEIGATQGAALQQLYQASQWGHLSVEQDWSGLDRFFSFEFQAVVV